VEEILLPALCIRSLKLKKELVIFRVKGEECGVQVMGVDGGVHFRNHQNLPVDRGFR
jgi:hypothetical protein